MAKDPGSRRRGEGVVIRHVKACQSLRGGQCSCRPGFQAQVWSARDGKTIRKTFRSLADARAWRSQMQTGFRHGTIRAPSRTTFNQAAEEWLTAAAMGVVLTRSGDVYKPSALRSYGQSLRSHVLPALGRLRLSAVTRVVIQDLVDRLLATGAAPSTVRNAVLPIRAIYRRAVSRTEVVINPTEGLNLQAVRSRRERVARPEEAAALIAAVPAGDRAIWATALYAGLRLGELKALRWDDIDFNAGLIYVKPRLGPPRRTDHPQKRSGTRRIPLGRPLRGHLAAHRLAQQPRSELAFGHPNGRPFTQAVTNRARTAWTARGLAPIGLHECRHSYASLMIAAGINPKALSSYMGHSSITTTLDRYGHLMPGNETHAANMLNTYLTIERG